MQKFNNPCIKTGDFAKLCNTNKRTLFHYDEIGLFSPAFTDEKGYRFYTESQADVFFTITCLKDIGMPLQEIKAYIDHRNPDDLKTLLLEQQKKVRQELLHLERIEHVIHTKLKLLRDGEQLDFDGRLTEVILEDVKEEYLIVSPFLDTNDHEKLFHALCEHISYCNHKELSTGNPYGAMLSVNRLWQAGEDIYAHFFTKTAKPPSGLPYMVKPRGKYAVVYLRGNYYDAGDAYQRLFEYFNEHHLTPGEFCYKEAVWDELTAESPNDYITRISIPAEGKF